VRIIRAAGFVFILAVSFASPGRAVEIMTSTGPIYNTSAPTGTNIPEWETGWTQPAGETEGTYTTGWNYVGQVDGGASGTYLGDGWVLTAGHVGAGYFALAGQSYDLVANSAQNIDSGSVDLTLFQINTTSDNTGAVLNLPALTLSMTDPTAFAYGTTGSSVAMIGFGGGQGDTWGLNTVTQVNVPIMVEGYSYVSNDFLTYTGTNTYDNPDGPGSESIINNAQVVSGDSGGGDFIYDTTTGQWELAGINEGAGTDNGQELSAFVQLHTYAGDIQGITGTPEPPASFLLGLGFVLMWGANRFRQRRRRP
jgi:hypothetical protein